MTRKTRTKSHAKTATTTNHVDATFGAISIKVLHVLSLTEKLEPLLKEEFRISYGHLPPDNAQSQQRVAQTVTLLYHSKFALADLYAVMASPPAELDGMTAALWGLASILEGIEAEMGNLHASRTGYTNFLEPLHRANQHLSRTVKKLTRQLIFSHVPLASPRTDTETNSFISGGKNSFSNISETIAWLVPYAKQYGRTDLTTEWRKLYDKLKLESPDAPELAGRQNQGTAVDQYATLTMCVAYLYQKERDKEDEQYAKRTSDLVKIIQKLLPPLTPPPTNVDADEITEARWRAITFITGTVASQVERIVGILLDKKLKTADEKLRQLEPFLGKSLGDSPLQRIADLIGVKAKQTIAQTPWYKDRKAIADICEESDGVDRCHTAKEKAKTVTFKNKHGEGDFAGQETRICTVKGKMN